MKRSGWVDQTVVFLLLSIAAAQRGYSFLSASTLCIATLAGIFALIDTYVRRKDAD